MWNEISCTKLQLPPESLTSGLPPPDPRSLCPQLNLLNPPRKKFLGTPLDWLLGKFLGIWTSHMVPFKNILTTDLSMRRESAEFVPRDLTVEQKQHFNGVALSGRFRFQLFTKSHNGRLNLGLWLWYWDQGSEFSMEITQFSCEKRASSKIQHQGGDDCVFWPWLNCASWVCTQEHYGELWIL